MEFKGFSPETIDFLWGIRFNNNKTWFTEHKQDYLTTLYEPIKALGAELYEPFREGTGMGYRVSRIYKDVRFSTGDPYKDHLWISIHQEADRWSAASTLYFEIRPEGYSYGLVFWRPQASIMQQFRRDLAERPEVLEMILKAEQEAGCNLGGEEYVRKKNQAPRPELERFYNLKGFVANVERAPDELLFQPELVDEVLRVLKALQPVNAYFQSLSSKITE